MTRFAALAMIGALAAPVVAEAAPRSWTVDAAASEIAIIYEINGDARRGAFSRFSGTGVFSPDTPEDATLNLVIDMKSVDVGERVATEIAKSIDWFFVDEHPEARYVLRTLTRRADGAFDAVGDLTLRGRTHPVTGTLTINVTGDMADATGHAAFNRDLFNIGVGATSLFVDIGDEVAVEFTLVARTAD